MGVEERKSDDDKHASYICALLAVATGYFSENVLAYASGSGVMMRGTFQNTEISTAKTVRVSICPPLNQNATVKHRPLAGL